MFLNMKEIYLPSWETFVKNWWEYIVVTAIMFLFIFVPLLGSIIQIFMALAIINAILKVVRGGSVIFSDFFRFKEIFSLKTVIFAAGLGVYYFVVQNAALFSTLLSLAGVVLSVIFFPLFCVLVDKKFNIKETVLYSAKLTKGIRTDILLVMLINVLICIAGAVLLFVGIFVAVPIMLIATVKVYTLLENRLNSQAPQTI